LVALHSWRKHRASSPVYELEESDDEFGVGVAADATLEGPSDLGGRGWNLSFRMNL